MSTASFPGRLLGIDHGLKVIGLAVCDATGLIARPLELLVRTSRKADFARINAVIARERIVACIVGLPVQPDWVTGYTQADRVRLWAGRLAAAVPVPVYLWNERLSSWEAEERLAEAGARRPERVDAAAAAVILQSFLDALREEAASWPEPVAPVLE